MIKPILFLLLIAMSVSNTSYAQWTVSTVVDSSAFGFTDDLIFDNMGNLYCADYSGDAIYKRTPEGSLSIFSDGFNTPNGLAFDSFGNLFVCDNLGNAIYKLNSSGEVQDTLSIEYPSGIIKDAQSDTMIYTTYGDQSALMKLAPNGTSTNFHSGEPLDGPVGLAYCQGDLYVANFNNREIYRVESDTLVFLAQLPGSGSLGFIADVGGQLMATAFTGDKIYTVDPVSEQVSLFSGGLPGHEDGPIEDAMFNAPNGIIANAAGDTIYISEYNGKRLRMITGGPVSIDNTLKPATFNVYPNPITTTMNLVVDDSYIPYSIDIVDLHGKTVLHEGSISDSSVELDLSTLESGSYVIAVQSFGTKTIEKKVIVMHE